MIIPLSAVSGGFHKSVMPFRKTAYYLLALLAFFVPSRLLADDQLQTLEEIVVTASRFDEKLTDVPANVTIIDQEAISNSTAQNIPDLLRTQVGIQVSDIDGNKRFYDIDLRGFGETGLLNTLVLVDGRRVNESDLSGTDWSQISLDRVERIEIIRGGRGSVLYGDNASGGVINIITKEGEKLKAGGEVAAGSYNTYSTNGYFGGTTLNNTLPFYFSGDLLTSEGYRDNSNLNMKDAGMNVNYIGIKDLKINIGAGYHWDNSRLPGPLLASDFAAGLSRTATTEPDNYSTTRDYYFKVTPEYFVNDDITLKMDMSYRDRTFVTYDAYQGGNFTGSSGMQTVALSPRGSVKTDISKNVTNNLIFGSDYQWSSNDITDTSLFFGSLSVGDYRMRKNDYGGYVQDELSLGKKLLLSLGYRKDEAEYSFMPSNPNNITLQANAYNAGINYTYYNKSYVYLTYSRSFRYPVFDELFSYYTNTISTDLKTQTSDNYEVGTRYYFTDDIYLHAGIFSMYTQHEIIYNPVTYTNENLDGITRRNGAELSVVAKVTTNALLSGTYTFMDATIRNGMFIGSRVPNVPRNMATMEGQYTPFKGFTVILNGSYVGRRPFISDFSNSFSDQNSYYVLNNKYKYKWKNITIFLNINNLTNQKYSEYGVIGGSPIQQAYYPAPRLNLLGGLSFEL